MPGQSYLHGFSQCMVSLWLLTSSFKEDAASSQFLQETPGRGPSPAQTTACNSRSLVGLAAEPVWQKQPDFPFNSCLAFQRDGQEKSAVSVLKKKKKGISPTTSSPSNSPSSPSTFTPLPLSELLPADKDTPQLPVCTGRPQPAGSKCHLTPNPAAGTPGGLTNFFKQENPCLLLSLRRKPMGEGGQVQLVLKNWLQTEALAVPYGP